MIEERLRVFEMAKLAKEKGFTTRTVTTNFTNSYLLGGKKVMITDMCVDLWLHELQKWLRDVKQTLVLVDFYNDGEEWEDTQYKVTVSEFKHFDTHDSYVGLDYDKYEEALEVGLLEALKLI